MSSPGAHRTRQLVLAGLSGLGGRGVVVVVGLALTPVIVAGLGDERYGVFATLTLAVSLLAFSDLGVGNGLIARMAAAGARGQTEEQRRLASAATALLTCAGAAVALVAVVLAVSVPWHLVLGAPSVAQGELRTSVLLFGLVVAVGVPGTVGQKVLIGLQRGARVNSWAAAGTLVGLAATAAAAHGGAPLPLVVVATVAPPVAVCWVQTWWLFTRSEPGLRPRWSDLTVASVTSLLRSGGLFLALSAAGALAFQTDLLVVSAAVGASAAAVLAITLRLFSLVQQVSTAALSQLWPAFADALAAGDARWVRRTWWRASAGAALAAAPVLLLLVLTGDRLIAWWVGPSLVPPTSLLVALALWTLQQAVVYPTAMLLNGAEIIRFQVVAATAMALANIALSIVLARAWGVAGPVWASLITHTLLNALPAVVLVWRRFLQDDLPVAVVHPVLAR